MSVYFVGAGAGDPELITLKGHRILGECDICIWAGSLVNPVMLDYLKEGAKVYDSASMNLDEVEEVIVAGHKEGKTIVRLHTGDPAIYGAITEQMNRLDKHDIDYIVIPGVSSFQASAAALQIELTLPEITQTIILSRMEGRTPVPDFQKIEVLAQSKSTLCMFLSVTMIRDLLKRVVPFYGEECPCAVVYKASWPDQKIIKGNLSNLADRVEAEGIRKTAMIIIGHAVDKSLLVAESKLYHKNFTHEYRVGTSENDK